MKEKIPPWDVTASNRDAHSIMHYHFQAGLILHPEQYQSAPLLPAPGLSPDDISQVRVFYPPLAPSDPELSPFDARVLDLEPGGQANFRLRPGWTGWYDFRTFGASDTVMVLFEDEGDSLEYRTGDDDSGYGTNASFRYKLIAGREYVLRIRLYWASAAGRTAVMYW